MSHSKEEELNDASEIMNMIIARDLLPKWDELSYEMREHVVKEINETIDAKYEDHLRHFKFGIVKDSLGNGHFYAAPIAKKEASNDE